MKEQTLPSPPGADVTASQGKSASIHMHSYPNTLHRIFSHKSYLRKSSGMWRTESTVLLNPVNAISIR